MKSLKLILIVVAMMLGSFIDSEADDIKSTNVTVYNQNIGVVRQVRSIEMRKGQQEIKITGVAEMIDPTSVHINFDGTVIEQNYRYDLASFIKILQKYIDKEISLVGKKNVITGTLISVTNTQAVIRAADGGLTLIPNTSDYQIAVGKLPEGLITRPTLVWLLDSESSGSSDVELSYMTKGMNWHAEYVAVLNEDDTEMDLNAWVSIENRSGAKYDNANLKLIAGDVNFVNPDRIIMEERYMRLSANYIESKPQFEEKSFFEYHIYNLQRKTTLMNNETKQISLFEAAGVKVKKKYLYNSYPYISYQQGNSSKAAVVVEFVNSRANNMGMPMPAGKVRLYKSDGESVELIGEGMVDHTPKDEIIKLKVGDAFDIVIEEKEVSRDQLAINSYESVRQILFKNRKDEDIVIEVESNLGYNWTILNSNIRYTKLNSTTVVFKVPVAKGEEKTLEYKVRYRN